MVAAFPYSAASWAGVALMRSVTLMLMGSSRFSSRYFNIWVLPEAVCKI